MNARLLPSSRLSFLALVASSALAQPGEAPSWGLDTATSTTLVSFDFVPLDQSGSFAGFSNSPNRYLGGPHVAAVRLPNGASIVALEVEGCDGSSIGGIAIVLKRAPAAGANEFAIDTAGTGLLPTPGCGNFVSAVNPTHVVDNAVNKYWVHVDMSPGDGSVALAAVRVRYRLQVSAAPAVATFPNDVPTSHVYFRFIEALAAAGITSGCAAGSFCPDAPITRGEMAVFLAAALGLHFPG
jgi:hypothetical protein